MFYYDGSRLISIDLLSFKKGLYKSVIMQLLFFNDCENTLASNGPKGEPCRDAIHFFNISLSLK